MLWWKNRAIDVFLLLLIYENSSSSLLIPKVIALLDTLNIESNNCNINILRKLTIYEYGEMDFFL